MFRGAFVLRRLWLLLRRDFILQFRTYLVSLGAIFGTLVVIYFVSMLDIKSGGFNEFVFPITLYLAGFVFTSLSFKELREAPSRIAYLGIPASNFEKLLSKLIITGPSFVIVLIVLYIVFSIFVAQATDLLFGLAHPIFNPFESWVWSDVRTYLTTQSIFLAGAIYFDRNSFLKTVLAIFVIGLLGILLLVGIYYVFHQAVSFNGTVFIAFQILDIPFDDKTPVPDTVLFTLAYFELYCHLILWYVGAPVLWLFAFFRLKEAEV